MKTLKCLSLAIFLSLSLTATDDAQASMKCYKEPDNASAGASIGGFDDKAKTIQQGYKKVQDPVQDLLGCFLQTAYEGPTSVIKECGCKEAIKENCSFKWKRGFLRISGLNGASTAWCVPFMFLAF